MKKILIKLSLWIIYYIPRNRKFLYVNVCWIATNNETHSQHRENKKIYKLINTNFMKTMNVKKTKLNIVFYAKDNLQNSLETCQNKANDN